MPLIDLKILLPYKIFCATTGVSRVVAETTEGSVGILPHRLDFVAALNPGIITYATDQGQETYVAVDQGVLVKTGSAVAISVRNAITGVSLEQLHEAVEKEFVKLSKQQQGTREAITKMENGLIRRFVEFQHE